jgi:hypothetical protein
MRYVKPDELSFVELLKYSQHNVQQTMSELL